MRRGGQRLHAYADTYSETIRLHNPNGEAKRSYLVFSGFEIRDARLYGISVRNTNPEGEAALLEGVPEHPVQHKTTQKNAADFCNNTKRSVSPPAQRLSIKSNSQGSLQAASRISKRFSQ